MHLLFFRFDLLGPPDNQVMMIFWFTGLAVAAVGKTAGEVVREVRRQFKENPGIMEYKQKPDYRACVSLVTEVSKQAARRANLLRPSALDCGFGTSGKAFGAIRPLHSERRGGGLGSWQEDKWSVPSSSASLTCCAAQVLVVSLFFFKRRAHVLPVKSVPGRLL